MVIVIVDGGGRLLVRIRGLSDVSIVALLSVKT